MKGWTTAALGDIFEIGRGGSPRPISAFLTDDPDGINWISISDATDSAKFITKTERRIKPSGVSRSRMVKEGDFLLTNSMSFGRPYIMKTTGCIHDGWLVLSDRTGKAHPDFFYHLLGSSLMYQEFERLAAGATVKNLNIQLVSGMKVPLPPLADQKRVAAILDATDCLRAARRASLSTLDALVQSILTEMFGNPATNPHGLPSAALNEIGEVHGGLQLSGSRKALAIEVPYLRVGNVYRNALVLDEVKMLRATPREIERTALQTGDILVVEGHGNAHEIGRCAVWDGSIDHCVHQNHLIRIRLNRKLALPQYVSFYLNSHFGRRQLLSAGKTTSGLNTISVSDVKRATLLLPPLRLQQAFVARLEDTNRLRNSLIHMQSRLDHLFASLQHRAFRGEL